MVLKAIVDVGVIVLSLEKNNPLREKFLEILEKCVRGEIIAYIPYTVILGTYHVLVEMFHADKEECRNKIFSLMEAKKINWIPDISKDKVKRAINHAVYYNFESWDGYLLSLMEDYDIKTIYTIDEDFKNISKIQVLGLLTKEEKQKLNNYLTKLKQKR